PRDRSPAHASKRIGTAFGTARLVEFALSADDALLFRPVGPFHHRGNTEPMSIILLNFNRRHKSLVASRATRLYAMVRRFSPSFDASVHTERTRRATFTRFKSGPWRVQVQRKGKYVNDT